MNDAPTHITNTASVQPAVGLLAALCYGNMKRLGMRSGSAKAPLGKSVEYKAFKPLFSLRLVFDSKVISSDKIECRLFTISTPTRCASY